MVDYRDILATAGEIARRFTPLKIILFGSYAYGHPTEDSDVDLMVVMNFRGSMHDKAVQISCSVPHRFPTDLLVRRPETIARRLAWNDYFLMDIFEKGIVLHDSADARMAQKGRKRLRRRWLALPRPKEAKLRRRVLSRAAVY